MSTCTTQGGSVALSHRPSGRTTGPPAATAPRQPASVAPRHSRGNGSGQSPAPRRLTVLYDGKCALCLSARRWLREQPLLVPLRFVPAGSPTARTLYPALDHGSTLTDITVIDDRGRIYRGAKAWVMCLWATRAHRARAISLTRPAMWPLAKRFIAWVSTNRRSLGGIGSMLLGGRR